MVPTVHPIRLPRPHPSHCILPHPLHYATLTQLRCWLPPHLTIDLAWPNIIGCQISGGLLESPGYRPSRARPAAQPGFQQPVVGQLWDRGRRRRGYQRVRRPVDVRPDEVGQRVLSMWVTDRRCCSSTATARAEGRGDGSHMDESYMRLILRAFGGGLHLSRFSGSDP